MGINIRPYAALNSGEQEAKGIWQRQHQMTPTHMAHTAHAAANYTHSKNEPWSFHAFVTDRRTDRQTPRTSATFNAAYKGIMLAA